MEIRETATYPYPIWGIHDSFIGDIPSKGIKTMTANSESNTLDIKYTVTSHNAGIDKLIEYGLAKYKCIADCSPTYYQDSVDSNEPELCLCVPFDRVYNRFTVRILVVATEEIVQCDYLEVDEAYEGVVDYPKGAVIAYLDEFAISLTQKNNTSDLSKIVKIMPTNINSVKYVFGPERITIKVPQSTYSKYQVVSGQCPAIAESNLVYNALVQALTKLRNESDDSKDWVFYLKQYVKECDEAGVINLEGDDFELDMEDILIIVDRLLENPHISAFDEIFRVIDNN